MHKVSVSHRNHHIEWNGGNTFQIVNELTGEAIYAWTSYRDGKPDTWTLESVMQYIEDNWEPAEIDDHYDN